MYIWVKHKVKMKPAKLLILVCCIVLYKPVQAQLQQSQLDSLIKNYTRQLQKSGIDTICVFEEYCIGCMFIAENGDNQCLQNILFLPTYIFWKKDGKTMMTKKDICNDYSVQQTGFDSFWQFYLNNKEKIKKEELKPPQYVEMVNGRKKISTLQVDRGIYFRISFNIAGNNVTKVINNYFFTKELGEKEEHNINYEYNVQSVLNTLHENLLKTVKEESKRKKLAATLRN